MPKPYVITYHKYFGYDLGGFVPCEVCGAEAREIHHLRPKSLEKKAENRIENLIAVCRECHDKCHGTRSFNDEASLIHRKNCLKHSNNPDDLKRYL